MKLRITDRVQHKDGRKGTVTLGSVRYGEIMSVHFDGSWNANEKALETELTKIEENDNETD